MPEKGDAFETIDFVALNLRKSPMPRETAIPGS
jgi:hypothetical protein